METQLDNDPFLFGFIKLFTDFADVLILLLVVGWIAARWLNPSNAKLNRALTLIIAPVLITAIVTLFLKIMIPRGPGGPLSFLIFNFQLPFPLYSFPSGHTSRAFALATSLGAQFPKWQAVFYFVAILIGFSRIFLGAHDIIEVIVGAILGTAISLVYINIVLRNSPTNGA